MKDNLDLERLTRAVFLNTGLKVKSRTALELEGLPKGVVEGYKKDAKRIAEALGGEKFPLDDKDIERLAETSWYNGDESLYISPEGKKSVWSDVHPDCRQMHRRIAGAIALALGFTIPDKLLKEVRSDERRLQTCAACASWLICEFCQKCSDWICDECREDHKD